MHRKGSTSFAVTLVALSLVLAWLFWNTSVPLGPRGSYSLADGMFVAPVVAAMLAAKGFPWKRKVAYALVSLVIFPVVLLIAEITGLNAYAGSQLSTGQAFPSLWTVLYLAFLATFPLAMLVLFAGRAPWLLWSTKDTAHRGRKA